MSVEVQFFVISSIILLIIKNHPRFGIIIFSSFFISSLISTTTLQFRALQPDAGINAEYDPSLTWLLLFYFYTSAVLLCTYRLSLKENLAFFNGFYDQPWSRLSPYIFGICVGYFLRKIESKLEINSTMIACGMYLINFSSFKPRMSLCFSYK